MKKATERTVLVKLHLPPDVHARLRALAALEGRKVAELAAEVLDKHLPEFDKELR